MERDAAGFGTRELNVPLKTLQDEGYFVGIAAHKVFASVGRPSGQLVPPPTAGDNPDGLSTATAAKGATPMAPDFQPWITRIDPNRGLLAFWRRYEVPSFPLLPLTSTKALCHRDVLARQLLLVWAAYRIVSTLIVLIYGKKDSRAAGR